MTPRTRAVFFDLGETLVTQNIEDNVVTKGALEEISRLLPRRASGDDLFQIYQEGYRVNHAIRANHHIEIPVENWMHQLLTKALGKEPDPMFIARAIRIIVKSRAANAVAFSDVGPTLEELTKQKKLLAVISNVSSHDVAVEILRRTELHRFFKVVITSASTGVRKPDPGIFLYALIQFGLRPAEVLHVGDSEEHDVQGAKTTGLKTMLVSRREPKRSIADYQVRSLAEASSVFRSL